LSARRAARRRLRGDAKVFLEHARDHGLAEAEEIAAGLFEAYTRCELVSVRTAEGESIALTREGERSGSIAGRSISASSRWSCSITAAR
jgi:hypothetical protein